MEIKKEQPTKKAGLRMSLGMKVVLIALLIALTAEMGIVADEIFNAKVVEYFERKIGSSTWAFVGIDTTSDGLADIFITIRPLEYMLSGRLANHVKNAGIVSVEDKNKIYGKYLGAYELGQEAILEIGGRSVLDIFPGEQIDFPLEAARQERLKREAAARPATPASPPPTTQETAEERRIRELEEELRRLREQGGR